ncbi:MAG: flavodoxin-dependent (E)-4-hydroxy-3-methylbut-2-enyl-diphosphate synthase [Thermodesulfobacteriota bacterium]
MTAFNIKRRKTRRIHVGPVPVGGGAPIAVQSMTNTDTSDVAATVAQIDRLQEAGCEIVRVAVPDMDAAEAIAAIKKQIRIPLIADVHFNWRLAVAALEAGADGLRINPGNIGGRDKTCKVIARAKEKGVPIRIGVNAGSVEKDLLKKHGGPTAAAMAESVFRNIAIFEAAGFDNIKISVKASDVHRTVACYRLVAEQCDYPLHVGVTEAGGLVPGLVKSSVGIGLLLADGIGDTIRVSLTRDPVEEVRAGFEILKALDIRRVGPEIISCPTCGRCRIDLFSIAEAVERSLMKMRAPFTVAVMGCAVNGPGEAKGADVGIAGGDGAGVLFKKGRIVKTMPEDKLVEALLKEAQRLEKQWRRKSDKKE